MSHCPENVVVVEPCGELSHQGDTPYLSKQQACGDGLSMINNVFPTSIKTFLYDPHFQHYDAVVCIGCDTTYGPTWGDLMAIPRPFDIVLESPTLAFGGQYPISDHSGCKLVNTKDFDFSSCEDCGFNDSAQQSQYARSRKLVMFHCAGRPQENNRSADALSTLGTWCDSAAPGTYRGMACLGEKNLMKEPIKDMHRALCDPFGVQ